MKNISSIQSENMGKDLKKVFGKDLIFAFICGSVAENNYHNNSDLDIFVLLNRIDPTRLNHYMVWYKKIHMKYKLKPDLEYPGEIVTIKELNEKLNRIDGWEVSLETSSVEVYAAIVWMSMLEGQYNFISGNKNIFNKYREVSSQNIRNIKNILGTNKKKFLKYNSLTLIPYTEKIANIVKNNKEFIVDILTDIESYKTAIDEISLTLDTLENIESQKVYVENHYRKLKVISVFMPLNLPLYSIILFIIIPSFFTKKTYISLPVVLEKTYKELSKILKINNRQDIIFTHMTRGDFLNKCCSISDVIVFVGKYEIARKIMLECPYSLLLHNGAGANPIIINKDCTIEDAVNKTVEMRTFNSGQDCAAPDAILVNEQISKDFTKLLQNKISKMKVGTYKNKENEIGIIIDEKMIPFIKEYTKNNKDHIFHNGKIDEGKKIIEPFIFLRNIKNIKKVKFEEFFSPIFNIIEFSEENELKMFFNKGYEDKSMILSVFGSFKNKNIFKKSIIIENNTLLHTDDGNLPFGGYGKEASFVGQYKKIIPRPVLISQEIGNWLDNDRRIV